MQIGDRVKSKIEIKVSDEITGEGKDHIDVTCNFIVKPGNLGTIIDIAGPDAPGPYVVEIDNGPQLPEMIPAIAFFQEDELEKIEC